MSESRGDPSDQQDDGWSLNKATNGQVRATDAEVPAGIDQAPVRGKALARVR